MSEKQPFDSWAIVELMGHLCLAGRVTEEERFGAVVGRVDIPQADGTFATQYFGGGSLYRLSVTTEEIARAKALRTVYAPVSVYDLPRRLTTETVVVNHGADDPDEEDDHQGYEDVLDHDNR